MLNSLILVEHNLDFSNFKNYTNSKFVSFDIVAHKKLQNLGIQHDLIEDYFSEDDKSVVDEKTIEICYEWYKQQHVSKHLEFDGVNLGGLLEIELFSYMIQSIKKFVGVIKLLQKENPDEIFCSSFLLSMVNEIQQKKEIKLNIIPNTSKPVLYFDDVEIPVNIGRKFFSIRISRNSAIRFKKSIENFFNIFFNFKTELKKIQDNENLLFLDFNPTLYEEMFTSISKTKFNILLLNERRPAAWNLSSLKLLKKLDCKIIILQDLNDSETSNQIEKEQKKLQNKTQDIFSNNEYFRNYFSIMGFSLWPSIKTDFISLCNERFNEAIRRLILSKKLFSNLHISRIVVLYSTGVEERSILSQSSKKNIPGLLLQHGYLPLGKFPKKYLNSSPIIPKFGLTSAIWGNLTKPLLTGLEVPEKNIKVIGSPRHDNFFHEQDSSKKDKILFVESFTNEVDFLSMDSKNELKNEEMIKKFISYLNNISGYELNVKLHPGKHVLPYSLKPIIQSVDSSIPIYKSGNILRHLKNCKVVIATEMTTTLMEAMILKIPTIVYLSHPKYNTEESILKQKATIRIETFEQFKSEIHKLLTDDDYRTMIINNGTNFINEQFHNQGNSSDALVKFLQE